MIVLQAEELLLPLDLLVQLLLHGHIEHIFRGKQTVVVVQYGVAGDVLIISLNVCNAIKLKFATVQRIFRERSGRIDDNSCEP